MNANIARSLAFATVAGSLLVAAPSFAQTVETTDTPAQTPVTTQTTTPQTTTTTTTQNGTTTTSTTATTGSNSLPAVNLTPAANNDSRHKHFTIGPELGVYMPMSTKTRNAFGDAWFNVGIGLGSLSRPDPRGQFTADLNLFGVSKGGGRDVLMAPVGVNYRRSLSPYSNVMPYVGIGTDFVISQLHSDPMGVESRVRGTYAGSLFTGIAFTDRGYVQARYYFMAPTRGYDLSGLNITTGFRF